MSTRINCLKRGSTTLIISLALLVACTSSFAQQKQTSKIGGLIEVSKAAQWTENYQATASHQPLTHAIGKGLIQTLLSQDGSEGLRVYHAADDKGDKQMIFVAVDSLGNDMVDTLMVAAAGDICTDVCETRIDIAARWTENYRAAFPKQPRAHMMGKDIIQRLLSQKGAEALKIYYALDDNGDKIMVFVATGKAGQDITINKMVADMSAVCPNMCSKMIEDMPAL